MEDIVDLAKKVVVSGRMCISPVYVKNIIMWYQARYLFIVVNRWWFQLDLTWDDSAVREFVLCIWEIR